MSGIKLWFVTVVYIWSISSEAFKITPVHIGDRTRLKSKTEKAIGKLTGMRHCPVPIGMSRSLKQNRGYRGVI